MLCKERSYRQRPINGKAYIDAGKDAELKIPGDRSPEPDKCRFWGGGGPRCTRCVMKMDPFQKIVAQIRQLFLFWMGWPRAPWKFGPQGGPKIFYFEYISAKSALGQPPKEVGQIRWLFRFWRGSVVTLGPRKAWSPHLWSRFSSPVWIFAVRCSKQCSM